MEESTGKNTIHKLGKTKALTRSDHIAIHRIWKDWRYGFTFGIWIDAPSYGR
jgi:hypothetical protein